MVAGLEPDEDAWPGGEEEETSSTQSAQRYVIIEEVARGGMGVVSRAHDLLLNRQVAIKQLPNPGDASREAIERFQREAESVASLQHPGIVAIHDVGTMFGLPFLAMDFVEGRTLEELTRDRLIRPRSSAAYLLQIAEAVHFAHSRGIVHRDLKPSNVMISSDDQVRITDFGLAKRIDDRGDLTATGQILGTPNYLSPEQASGRLGSVGPKSDIYCIGAILYQLLTGRPPFASDSIQETLLQIRDREPVAPSLLNPTIPRDLETICLKCLNKEPAGRYATAQDVASELRNFLEHRPIKARPLSRGQRLVRWARRNQIVAGLSAALLVVVGLAFAANLRQVTRLRKANLDRGVQLSRLSVLNGSYQLQNHDAFKAMLWFTAALAELPAGSGEAAVHRQRIASCLTYSPRLVKVIDHNQQPIAAAGMSPGGGQLATVGADSNLLIHHLEFDSTERLVPLDGLPIALTYSPTGKAILVSLLQDGGRSVLVDASTGEILWRDLPHNGVAGERTRFLKPCFDSRGELVLTRPQPGVLQIWDAEDRTEVGDAIRLDGTVIDWCFSPDSRQVWVWNGEGELKAWDISTGSEGKSIKVYDEVRWASSTAITSRVIREKRPWDPLSGVFAGPAVKQLSGGGALSFDSQGSRFLVGNSDGEIGMWDASTGERLIEPIQEHLAILAVDFSPDATRFTSVTEQEIVRVRNADSGFPLSPPIPHVLKVGPSEFDSRGRFLLTVHPSRVAYVWDLHSTFAPPLLIRGKLRSYEKIGGMPDRGQGIADMKDGLLRVRRMEDQYQFALNPISLDTRPIQGWIDETGNYVGLESNHALVQVWSSSEGGPITPIVPSRYAFQDQDYQRVDLPVIEGDPSDLVSFAELLSGFKLDGEDAWTLMERSELIARWHRLREVQPSWFGAHQASSVDWHRTELERAIETRSLSAAKFHVKFLEEEVGSGGDYADWRRFLDQWEDSGDGAISYGDLRRAILPRAPSASSNSVDLSGHLDLPLGNWRRLQQASPPSGLQTYFGIEFDCRGWVAIDRMDADSTRPRVREIPVVKKADRIHLLHQARADGSNRVGEEVVILSIIYEDGEMLKVPIRNGFEVANAGYSEPLEPEHAKVAWVGRGARRTDRLVRLFHYPWVNPFPDRKIQSLELRSTSKGMNYRLLGITLE